MVDVKIMIFCWLGNACSLIRGKTFLVVNFKVEKSDSWLTEFLKDYSTKKVMNVQKKLN